MWAGEAGDAADALLWQLPQKFYEKAKKCELPASGSHLQEGFYLTDLETSLFGEGKPNMNIIQLRCERAPDGLLSISRWCVHATSSPGLPKYLAQQQCFRQLLPPGSWQIAWCNQEPCALLGKVHRNTRLTFLSLFGTVMLFHRAASDQEPFSNTWNSSRRVILAFLFFFAQSCYYPGDSNRSNIQNTITQSSKDTSRLWGY